jgi:hypothetical protein
MCKVLRLFSRANTRWASSAHGKLRRSPFVPAFRKFAPRQLPDAAGRLYYPRSYSDNNQLRYQSAIEFAPAIMAFSSLDPARFRPHNRVYGKNRQFAIPSSLDSSGAGLSASSGGMRRRFGRIQYSTTAAHDRGTGSIAIDVKFWQRRGG